MYLEPSKIKYSHLGKKFFLLCIAIIILGHSIPEQVVIPVKNATSKDWNHQTFWYEPWGVSGVHKGIDIFAKKDTDLLAATSGAVLFVGELSLGGKVILVLGPKCKLHYYAHLESVDVKRWSFVSVKQKIGSVGDSGNAKGKPPHLHYSVVTLIPYPWLSTSETQGWKKMFYLDPSRYLIQHS